MATKFIGLLLSAFCSSALAACQGPQNLPGQYIDVTFEKNSSAISNSQLVALASWSLDIRARFPISDSLSVIGLAERFEHNPQQLGKARADQVHATLHRLGIKSEKEDVVGRIYIPRDPPSLYDEHGQRVEVTFSPGCPSDCCKDSR
ncbi:conserved exported hypothetical protein [Burkholderia sp. 8Y]|uniref:hypothetical protein n=1 Tax=Burkholderia sp. 8Y TaxID=2653133 RepID=UPI0012F46A1D|nr:hypothetical protein [Burkholderia sp. 8Y]VXC53987.1 conserved exported hypothetical protein [Burkholderia sp. 8Y]